MVGVEQILTVGAASAVFWNILHYLKWVTGRDDVDPALYPAEAV